MAPDPATPQCGTHAPRPADVHAAEVAFLTGAARDADYLLGLTSALLAQVRHLEGAAQHLALGGRLVATEQAG